MKYIPTILLLLSITPLATDNLSQAAEPSPNERRLQAMQFHIRAQQRTGLLVPMYIYPTNVHQNAAYNRLIELKRQYATVPIWVIVNPASGPGNQADDNYTKAIDRLRGAGCVVLGYVATNYGKRPQQQVTADIDSWLKLYPRTHGIFFDEMIYEDNEQSAAHQAALNRYAHSRGCWPTVANPGANTPGRYFAANAADVIVIHESANWPDERTLHGNYFGGHADYPPFTRAILLHSQTKLDRQALSMARKYVRWVYITDDKYHAGDEAAQNPWDSLSNLLQETCEQLSKD